MVPWETLRRLLGLPSGAARPEPSALVAMALDEPDKSRLIAMALGEAGGDAKGAEAPAAVVLGAIERGRVAPAVACVLLGAIGHPTGYRFAARTLADPEVDEETALAAAVAMARIAGPDALADLSLPLRRGPSRELREAAARGLTELEDGTVAASIAEAGRDGRIRARVAASCIGRLPFDPELWLDYLAEPDRGARRLATEVVYVLIRQDDESAAARLAALGEVGREAVRAALADDELYMLPDKRQVLEGWLES